MTTKQYLKRFSRLYFLLQRVYYSGLFLSERYLLGTKLNELIWRVRGSEREKGCSISHPHRRVLMNRIERFAPFQSLLEVGCNYGPNLAALREKYPDVQLHGIDISADAIKEAKALLFEKGVGNVNVFVGKAHDLGSFPDKSVDIILTDATLMYVGPDKIAHTLSEMVRVARKGLVFNEWNNFTGPIDGPRSIWLYAHWVHPFRDLLNGIPGVKVIHVERLPDNLWEAPSWKEYGAFVEVELIEC